MIQSSIYSTIFFSQISSNECNKLFKGKVKVIINSPGSNFGCGD